MNSLQSRLRVILTGASGMVGEGVLHECLQHDQVDAVLVIGRRPCGITHPKLRELLHENFHDINPLRPHLTGYNACFFCLGVSSIGMKEAAYRNVTYNLTLHFAEMLCSLNPDMTFCYISGAGTDATEKGRLMWARVKGKTENDLCKLPFRAVYNFRPALLTSRPGLTHTHPYYKWVSWLIPLVKWLAPHGVSSLGELGQAMIRSALQGAAKTVLEVPDIKALAKR